MLVLGDVVDGERLQGLGLGHATDDVVAGSGDVRLVALENHLLGFGRGWRYVYLVGVR